MQFLWVYIDEMVGKGLEALIILELLFYASANLVPMALPLAVLLSSIMTFGNLGENYELVALKSAGLSLQRIMFPLIVFMVMLSAGAFVFSNSVWPVANLKFASLLYDVRSKKPALDIQDNVYYKDIDGYVIRVKNRDEKTDLLSDIIIYDHTQENGNNRVIRAETGKMEMGVDKSYMLFTLKNGSLYDEMEGIDDPLYRSTFSEKIIRFDLSGFNLERSDEEIFKNNYRMMSISQIAAQTDTLTESYELRKQEFRRAMGGYLALIQDSIKLKPIQTAAEKYTDWFEKLPKAKKQQYLNWAINAVRSTQTYNEAFMHDFKYRAQFISKHKIEWHRKFTLSIACLILFFIGAPLGAIIRKGGLGMPVVISVLFFLLFHITSITGEKMVKTGELTALAGMWLSSAILTPIGVFLTYKATTDSAIMDTDFYKKFFSKLLPIGIIKKLIAKKNG